MKKIGLISDTHSYLDPNVFRYFEACDEIWHAGDFGSVDVSDSLAAFKPLRGVYGNVDGTELRKIHPLLQRFVCEGLEVMMIHIGGYPGHYLPHVKSAIKERPCGLFISGHSHILRIIRDKEHNLLHINPGAAGKEGFHKMRTIVRFEIEKGKIGNAEVIELGSRG